MQYDSSHIMSACSMLLFVLLTGITPQIKRVSIKDSLLT